jgi:signal transduction histidine kinase
LKLLTAFEKRHNLEIEAKLSPEPLLSLEAKEGVYRISQEILQNVAKHAAATSVKFSLIENGPNILLEISDNGRGFDSSAHFPGHFGLSNIRERAMLLHANLKIESHPGHGTCIQVDFPLSN